MLKQFSVVSCWAGSKQLVSSQNDANSSVGWVTTGEMRLGEPSHLMRWGHLQLGVAHLQDVYGALLDLEHRGLCILRKLWEKLPTFAVFHGCWLQNALLIGTRRPTVVWGRSMSVKICYVVSARVQSVLAMDHVVRYLSSLELLHFAQPRRGRTRSIWGARI